MEHTPKIICPYILEAQWFWMCSQKIASVCACSFEVLFSGRFSWPWHVPPLFLQNQGTWLCEGTQALLLFFLKSVSPQVPGYASVIQKHTFNMHPNDLKFLASIDIPASFTHTSLHQEHAYYGLTKIYLDTTPILTQLEYLNHLFYQKSLLIPIYMHETVLNSTKRCTKSYIQTILHILYLNTALNLLLKI